MKILQIITKSEMGGAQRHVLDLVRNSNKKAFTFEVACGGDGKLITQLKKTGIRTHIIPELQHTMNPIKMISLIKKIRRLSEEVDVVHCHSTFAGFWGRVASKKTTVFTAHGFAFKERTILKPLYFFIDYVASFFTDYLIAVSKEDYKLAKRYKLGKEIVYIPNGVAFNKKIRPSNNRKTIICTIANLYKNKGIEYLIEATKTIPDIEVRIIGDGPLRKKLERMSHNNIEFTGRNEDFIKEIAKSDIVVMSSLKEGMPYTILDAASLKKAVIATSVGGIPDLIKTGNNGILVKPEDVKAIKKAIETLIKDKSLRRKYGNDLYKRAKEAFSLKKMINATEKVYTNARFK